MITTQEEGLAVMLAGNNTFLTGMAGSGKSFLINAFREAIKQENKRNIVVTATTGIAAQNIDGLTLAQFTGMGLGPKTYEREGYKESIKDFVHRISSVKNFIKDKEPEICRMDILVIDEISMMDGYLLDCLNYLLQVVRADNRPFGGAQVIMCGDHLQLPPVNKQRNKPTDWSFYSDVWGTTDIEVVNLTKIYRQRNEDFQRILNEVRIGNLSYDCLQTLRSRVVTAPKYEEGIVRIVNTKAVAYQINEQMLDAIDEDYDIFNSKTEGDPQYVEYMLKNMTTPSELVVKKHCQYIITTNDRNGQYFNGTACSVIDFTPDSVYVYLPKTDTRVWISKQKWTNENYAPHNKLASVEQIPLKYGYAITAHGSQGLTLDAAHVDTSDSFECGQTYVALSRAKSLDRLYLPSFRQTNIKTSKEVVEYYKQLQIL